MNFAPPKRVFMTRLALVEVQYDSLISNLLNQKKKKYSTLSYTITNQQFVKKHGCNVVCVPIILPTMVHM